MRSARTTFWISQTITLAVIAATALPLCGQMFRCGCALTSGAQHCNVHHADGGPQCPWCVASGKASILSFLVMLPGSAAAIHVVSRWRRSVLVCTLVGSIVYFLLAASAGFVTAHAMGYPTWFGWRL
jgi:hypothetical protein